MTTYTEEEIQKEEAKWDPDEAKKEGTLKGIAEYKIDVKHEKTSIEFTEPKAKKKVRTSAKTIVLKKNKNGLF